MKIAVLGAAGFIGTHLVDRLLNDGHDVVGFGRGPDSINAGRQRYSYVLGDFSQRQLVRDTLETVDVCFHLISSTTPGTAEAAPAMDVISNLAPAVDLVDHLSRVHRDTRLIFLSSGGTVYGNAARIPTPEESPLEPLSIYGLTKVAIERYLRLIGDASGLDYLILRPSNVYGPTHIQNGFGIINHYLRKVRAGEPIEVWGDGSNVRDYLYIDDLTDLLRLAVNRTSTERVVNIGSGRGHSIMDVIELVEAAVGRKGRIEFRKERPIDVITSILDVRRAAAELGWVAKTELREGIQLVAESLHAQ